jgi:hypothetical protein
MRKLTADEFTEVTSLRQTLLEIITAIGELHLEKWLVASQLEEISTKIADEEKRFAEFRNNERVLFETLQQKYGTSDIDIETGEILG